MNEQSNCWGGGRFVRRRRLHRYLFGAGLLMWSLVLALGPAAADGGASREMMADAMSRMMEAMGFLGSAANVGNPMAGAGMPSPFNMPGWGMGSMPGAGLGSGQMGQYGRMGQEWMDRFSGGIPGMSGMPGMSQMPWFASSLEGVWEAAGGGLLVVQGGFYRLYSPRGGFVDGHIEVAGQQVRMWSPSAGFDLRFEYAEDQGRLALRDEGGQLYLYRRLVLNGGEG